jgi:hypothetical protein
MGTDQDIDSQNHDRQVHAVTAAVAKLLAHLGPSGFTPEAIFEGAVKGGAAALLAGTPATAGDVAALLETVGAEFRHLDKPCLRVVQ